MPTLNLRYDIQSTLDLVISIDGNEKYITKAVIDTGFRHNVYGLKLPLKYSQYAANLMTGTINQADDKPVDVQWVNTSIKKVQDFILPNEISIGTLFMGHTPVIGTHFLKRYKICFDGPNNQTTLELG